MKNADLARFYDSYENPSSADDAFVRVSDISKLFESIELVLADDSGIVIEYKSGIKIRIPLVGGTGITVDANEDQNLIVIKEDQTA